MPFKVTSKGTRFSKAIGQLTLGVRDEEGEKKRNLTVLRAAYEFVYPEWLLRVPRSDK